MQSKTETQPQKAAGKKDSN